MSARSAAVGRHLLRAVLTIALVLTTAATAGGSAASGGAAKTLATMRGHVLAFAQDRGYAAWLTGGGWVVLANLRTGSRARIRADSADGLVVAGVRAYWTEQYETLSTFYERLVTASAHGGGRYPLDFESVPQLGLVELQSPASDGRSVYFWSKSDAVQAGPVVRFDGLRRQRLVGGLSDPFSLAAGGGRLAVTRGVYDYDDASAPAWSPDGTRIAYTRHGIGSELYPEPPKLWVMNADGSDRHRIAEGSRPDWSPDGTQIAYGTADGSVVIANADGTGAHVVTEGADPAWSPDGKRLAFEDHGGIWTVGIDGAGRRLVMPNGAEPDWSPDGKQLVYVRIPAGSTVDPGDGRDRLVIVDADGSAGRTVGDFYGDAPAWSPDGREIAFGCLGNAGSQLCEVHPDGTGLTTVQAGATNGDQDVQDPSWAPDSTRVAYVQCCQIGDNVGDYHVFISPGNRQVTHTGPLRTPIVVYSRTGRKLAEIDPHETAVAVALSRTVTAALVHGRSGWRIDVYTPVRRSVRLIGKVQHGLAADGATLVFQVGHSIDVLQAAAGRPRRVATVGGRAIGLSLVGRRIAWAENGDHTASIQVLMLPTGDLNSTRRSAAARG